MHRQRYIEGKRGTAMHREKERYGETHKGEKERDTHIDTQR